MKELYRFGIDKAAEDVGSSVMLEKATYLCVALEVWRTYEDDVDDLHM